MLYKIREDCRVTWPDGSTWAEAGDVVEMMDDIEPRAAAEYMQSVAVLGGARRACVPAEEGDEAKAVELPADIVRALENRGWSPAQEPPKPPKRTRRKKATSETDSTE